jgi:hypothetical protein
MESPSGEELFERDRKLEEIEAGFRVVRALFVGVIARSSGPFRERLFAGAAALAAPVVGFEAGAGEEELTAAASSRSIMVCTGSRRRAHLPSSASAGWQLMG